MWQKLYEALSRLVTLTVRVERHDEDIKELRGEVRELTGLVHRLAMEVSRLADKQADERERVQLWLENQLLKFERRLPPAVPEETEKSSPKKAKK